MADQWSATENLISQLAYFVKNDQNGIQLYDTASGLEFKSSKSSSLMDKLDQVKPHQGSSRTNPSRCIEKILRDYMERVEEFYTKSKTSRWQIRPRSPVNPMTIYIFTDGVWQPGCDMASPIRGLISKMIQYDLPKDQVGIQFIQFGDYYCGGELAKFDLEEKPTFNM